MSSDPKICAILLVIYDPFNPGMACCVPVLRQAKEMAAKFLGKFGYTLEISYDCKECGRHWSRDTTKEPPWNQWNHIKELNMFHKIEDVPHGWRIISTDG